MTRHYGIGAITAPTILAELGDARRFGGGDQVVRATGLDITVYASDGKRSPGHLSRQGPEVLRWALFEAAKAAARSSSPDYAYYTQVKARQGGNRASLAVARKLARRVRHTLVALGDAALVPVQGLPLAAVARPRWLVRALPIGKQRCRDQRLPTPCRHGRSVDGPKRPRGRAPRGHPIDHLVAGPWWVRAPR